MTNTDKYKKQINFIISNITGSSELFPVYNCVFLENKYMDNISKFRYNLVVKNTETMKRAILLLYKDHELNKKSVLILKDGNIMDVIIICKEEYHNGTLFDVSFDDEKIIIYDTYFICDYKVNNESYSERLNRCNLFTYEIINSEKKIECGHILSDIRDVNLKNSEELFFIPETIPYISGINKVAFKWKPSNLIMISLNVSEDIDGLNFYTTNFRNYKLFAKLYNATGSEIINNIKDLDNYNDNCIIDFNIENQQFVPKRVNLEKIYPDNIRYIEKILFVKHEALDFLDFNVQKNILY